jgi:hypothetical protein
MGWLERQPEALKESRAFPDGMVATAQSVHKERKVSRVYRGYKVSKVHKVSKAHKASKALREVQDNPGSFCRRASHHLVRQIARLANPEDGFPRR